MGEIPKRDYVSIFKRKCSGDDKDFLRNFFKDKKIWPIFTSVLRTNFEKLVFHYKNVSFQKHWLFKNQTLKFGYELTLTHFIAWSQGAAKSNDVRWNHTISGKSNKVSWRYSMKTIYNSFLMWKFLNWIILWKLFYKFSGEATEKAQTFEGLLNQTFFVT